MTDYRLILRLLLRGHSYRNIQSTVGCSPGSISKASGVLEARQLSTASVLDSISDEELHSWFVDARSSISDEFLQPDFDAIVQARRFDAKKTVKQLWLDYCSLDVADGRRHYGHDRFRELLNNFIAVNDLVTPINHTPAHTMQVDWVGPKLELVDACSGRTVRLDVFVALLPYSGMLTASAHRNQKMTAWLDAHRQAFEYFGGTPNAIVPDNASTASNRIDKSSHQRRVNPTYQDFLAFYNTAAVPTRSRKPRDKGGVEAGVKIITRDVLAVLAGQEFIDLDDVNERMAKLVDEINDRVGFRRRPICRRDIFNADEQQLLHPLPSTPYQQVSWYTRVVGRDFHIEISRIRYSVPYTYATKTVKARVIGDKLDIFADSTVIATHHIGYKAGMFVTDPGHQPEYFADYADLWSRPYFLRQGSKVGPFTRRVIEDLLDSKAIEAQGYRSCRNILDLGKNNANADVLESACQHLLDDTGRKRAISYTAVKDAMAYIRAQQAQRPQTPKPHPSSPAVSARDTSTAHLVGPDIFSLDALMARKEK